ncbi:MAG TPA: hypothetical protein DCQ28_06935 [Bacteroidetes bacterium]|nr:hypothetical protein [Bacteroidota bacterium]
MLNNDFKEFIQLLNVHNVQYLIVGGYAVAFHGHPRYTKDIDIWIWMEQTNAEHMLDVLKVFGFSSLGLQRDDFLKKNNVVQLGNPPNRIDILTDLSGVVFEECYPKRNSITIDGIAINFIDIENLIQNKKASGRHQDLADIENLKE